MKKIAYIILSKNHKADFKKGILNKSLSLAGCVTDLPYAWKASELMNERLQNIGIVICLNGYGEICEKSSEMIEDICFKENISYICLGEAAMSENYFSLPVLDGSISAFKANAKKVFSEGEIISVCGVIADDFTDYAYIEFIASKVCSIYLYGPQRDNSAKIAERLFKNEGVAAHVCSEVCQLERCDKILSLSKKVLSQSLFLQRCEKCCDMFDTKELSFVGYTNNLGEILLNASYADALLL